MKQKELNNVIHLHSLWIDGEDDGECADLRDENLTFKDLSFSNLSRCNMRGVDMRAANTVGASFNEADMRDVNIDYSAWPLDYGTLKAYVDDRIAIQLLYHTLSVVMYSPAVSEDVKRTLLTRDVVDVANRFHHVDECGKLKTWEEIKGEA